MEQRWSISCDSGVVILSDSTDVDYLLPGLRAKFFLSRSSQKYSGFARAPFGGAPPRSIFASYYTVERSHARTAWRGKMASRLIRLMRSSAKADYDPSSRCNARRRIGRPGIGKNQGPHE